MKQAILNIIQKNIPILIDDNSLDYK